MKRSKIFLAATTGLLDVVAFVTAGANSRYHRMNYFTNTHNCTRLVFREANLDVTTNSPVGNTAYGFSCTVGQVVYLGE